MRKNARTPENDEKRFWAKVKKGNELDCWEWIGSKVGNGYGHIIMGTKFVYAHRFIYELKIQKIPEGMHIDHVCHNRACVNPAHMRLATHAENCHNMAMRDSNKCGFKGVYMHGKLGHKNPWMAQIVINNVHTYLGIYPTPEEAHEAYCKAAIKYHGEFANFGVIRDPI